MKSLKPGKDILQAEVTNISEHGFWLFLAGKEYFLPFDQYPWFKEATVAQIVDVEVLHGHHLYWSKLDVDLTTEILEHPERYPLSYN